MVLHPEFYESHRSPGKLPRMPSFVLQHAGPHTQFLCHPYNSDDYLSEHEIPYFLYHLLVALDALHSKGIMHRDVKPRNILITRDNDNNGDDDESSEASLMLIDLGLADFYLPNKPYNVRVASRHYKAPELLIGYQYYGYGVDLWPVGCILAGVLFRREPFFRGKDNEDQLRKIVSVLGTRDLIAYMAACGMNDEDDPNIAKLIREEAARERSSPLGKNREGGRVAWMSFLRAGCPVPSAKALDLLDKLLVYDHSARLTAEEAMAHPFFDTVRDRVIREVAEREQQS